MCIRDRNRSSSSASDQLAEVTKEWGLSGADIMIAFSDKHDGSIVGLAYRGQPYAIIFDMGYDSNWGTAQHEVGHMYGLRDYCTGNKSDLCCASGVCIMNGGNKDKICMRCLNKLEENKNLY